MLPGARKGRPDNDMQTRARRLAIRPATVHEVPLSLHQRIQADAFHPEVFRQNTDDKFVIIP